MYRDYMLSKVQYDEYCLLLNTIEDFMLWKCISGKWSKLVVYKWDPLLLVDGSLC